jgi:hypothetical protein
MRWVNQTCISIECEDQETGCEEMNQDSDTPMIPMNPNDSVNPNDSENSMNQTMALKTSSQGCQSKPQSPNQIPLFFLLSLFALTYSLFRSNLRSSEI